MLSYSFLQSYLRTVVSINMLHLVVAYSTCQFPDFLLLPNTNQWWSGGVTSHTASKHFTQQLTVRGDLRKMILSYEIGAKLKEPLYQLDRPYDYPDPAENSSYTSAVHFDLRCSSIVDKTAGTYMVEMRPPDSRSLYICMRFRVLDKGPTNEVFELIQGNVSSMPNDCKLSHRSHRSTWIPDLSKYVSTDRRSRCPLVGGFQAKNFRITHTNKLICPSTVYVTIDSECIRGEGIEFHFNDPTCNPFEKNLMTKFACFTHWTEFGSTNAILIKAKEDDNYMVVSMAYQETPATVDLVNNEYASFERIYLGFGIFQVDFEAGVDGRSDWSDAYPAYLNSLELFDTTLKTLPATLYEVQIRGAFGVCDDEMEQCERGCNADARNRLFCRRSCPSVRKECNMAHSDSCEIGPSYRGLWRLIDALPNSKAPTELQYRLRKFVDISDRTVTFANVLGDETFYEFSCLREASEIVPDWYILGGRQLQPGCHPRDICLEVHQNRPIFSNEAPNSNTLLLSFSRSQRQGVDISNLCTFLDESGDSPQKRPQMLVKQERHEDLFDVPNGQIFNASKCELYQIKLRGSIKLRAQFFSNLLSIQAASHSQAFGQPSHPALPSHESHSWALNDAAYMPEMVSCAIELSDFNPNMGTTGGFDGFLRLKSSCSVDAFSKFTNTAHQCISVHNLDRSFKLTKRFLMLVTYSEFLSSFFCWIIQESEIDGRPTFKIHLFLTPQCQYVETSSGEIIINNSSSVAIMHVFAEKDPFLNREQNTQPEQTKIPVFQKFQHLESGISVIHQPKTSSAALLRLCALDLMSFLSLVTTILL